MIRFKSITRAQEVQDWTHIYTATNISFVDNRRYIALNKCGSRKVVLIPAIDGSNPAQRMTFKQSYVTVTPVYN